MPPEPPGPSLSANITWKSGVWLRERSTRSASTRRSNGTSWCWYAPSVPSRTRPSSAWNDGLPERSVRSASVLTKKPISPSVSRRVRLAMGVPTTTSSCPDQRASNRSSAASSTMYGVAPSRLASVRTPSAVSGASARNTYPARGSGAAARGWSVGSSSTGGAPPRRSRHQAICPSRTSPASQARCQTAKSAYCTSSSGSGDASPRANAS